VAVVVTVGKGYDLGYVWKNQGQAAVERTTGGYYINAAQDGEPPGRRWGPGAQALGFTPGQIVERKPYDAVYKQRDPRTGEETWPITGQLCEVRRSSGAAEDGRAACHRRAGDRAGARGGPSDPAARRL